MDFFDLFDPFGQQGQGQSVPGSSAVPVNALGQLQQAPQMPAAQPAKDRPANLAEMIGGGFGNVLGRIGDALLVGAGGEPQYAPRLEQKRIRNALQNFLTDPQGAVERLVQEAPEVGIPLWAKMQRDVGVPPETIRLMEAAGIDPRSPEGQHMIRGKLEGRGESDPNFVRELNALGIDPRSDEARELYYGRNSPAGYLLKPPPRGGGGGGGAPAQGLPRVNTPEEARRLPPGTKFLMPDGRVGTVPGGQAAPPPGNFP